MKNKLMKKVVTLALAATLALSTVCTAFAADSATAVTPAAPVKASNGATVVVSADKTATVSAVKKTKKATVTLASTVKVDGVKYTVTTVGANAFKNATKAKAITLPKTITSINAKAFATNKKLTKITLKGTKAVTVNKNAFKGLNKSQKKKIVVYYNKSMSKAQVKKLKAALKKAGISTKNIKAK